MAVQLGSAYGKVEIDSSGVTSGVSSAVTGLSRLSDAAIRVGDTMRNIGNSMTIGLTLPILAMGGASIKAASDLNESLNKVNVVFGESSDQITKWAQTSATAMGISKQQALEAAGTFGNLFSTMGIGKKDAADMSMSLVKLASDLASFNDITPDEALIKLRAGLVGEAEPLRTLGVNLTAATVQAKAMQMGLADANGQLSQSALLQARYALILEQTTTAQGDFARTSDSLANQARSLKANFQDLLGELGTNLLPLAIRVVQGLNKMLEAFNNMPEPVQNAILVFAGFVAALGPVISFLGTIISMIGGIASFAGYLGGLGVSFAGVASAAGAAGSVLMAFGTAALSALGSILLLATGPLILYLAFKNNFGGITTTVKQLWFVIKFYFTQMTQSIMNAIKKINWQQLGKYMLLGIANGMLGGIPLIIMAASKAATAALAAIKGKLGIHSPSTEFMKLGAFSGKGFQIGLEKMMDPGTIAKTMAKPSNSFVNTAQNSYTMQFGSGLTLRDVDRMMEQKLGNFTRRLNKAVGA